MKFLRFFLLLFFTLSILGGLFFLWQGIYLPKNYEENKEKIFQIKKGENFFEISENLEKEGLIKNKRFFQVYVLIKKGYKNLKAGNYCFNSSMSIAEIAEKILKGQTIKLKITIPEGFTIKQIEERIEKISNFKAQSSKINEEKAIKYREDYKFLQDVPDDFNLEGFLFPDTYEFDVRTNDEEIVRKMLDNFDKKLTSQLRKEIKKQGKTVFDIVKMASLLEKEVKTFEDKKLVSGILWKRLRNNMPLQVDATIAFITGKKGLNVSSEETKIDSPYNTYKYRGLPIGPICNPGLDSLLAAIYPEKSDFWYYLSTPEGKTIFSRTLQEHNLAKAKYLN